MKHKLLSCFLLGMLLISVAFAQDRTIAGRITDAADGSPLGNVTVRSGNNQTQSDASGRYAIQASQGSILVFTILGYNEHRATVGTSNTLDVALNLATEEIDQIVITGYQTIRKSEFAGSATILSAKTTENRPVGAFTQALQGRAPGVLVNSGSGQPGANATITIRGVQSISGAGAQPLYIIDGIPSTQNDFHSLNPNDFESLVVLKDANAAAMYGARAGVGVILINTKQGRTSGEAEFTARVQNGYTMRPDFSRLNLMSTEEILEYQEIVGLYAGDYTAPGWTWSRKNPRNADLPEATLLDYDRKLDSIKSINTNIPDLLFRTGRSQTYELSARGGNQNTQFFVSGSFFDQEGIDLTSGLTRYTGRVNLGHTVNKLKINSNTTFGYSNRIQAVGDLYGNSPINPFQMVYRAFPYDNPYKEDGTLNFGGGSTALNNKALANLLESNLSTRDNYKQIKLNTGLTLSYEILDGLIAKNVLGVDMSSSLRETYIDPGSYRGSVQTHNKGFAREGVTNYSQVVNTTSLSYTQTVDDIHKFSVAGYFEALRVRNKGLGFSLYNLNPSLPWTGQGASPLPVSGTTAAQNASSASSGYGIRSYFAVADYTYNDKISVNFNIRRDGTSRIFNETNREITTWSAGAIWNVDRENFFQDQSVMSSFRLRGSFGIVPNIGSIGTGSYSLHGVSILNYAGSQLPAFGTTSYAGSTLPGLVPSSPGNPNLKIETIHKTNFGLDAGFWNERINLILDVYNNRTVDMFVRQPLSATTGFGNLDINAGEMSNKGFEAILNVDVIRNSDMRLTLGANHSMNINKIEDLGLVDEYFLGTFVIRKGLPYGSHYDVHYLGADPETGMPTYEREDGSVTNNINEAGEFAKFGTYLPKHVGGFNADISYKGFFVNANFSYQFDVMRSNNVRNWITDGSRGYISAVNQSRELLTDQWRQPGDVKWFPKPGVVKGFTSSDIEDAKFLRFRSLDFGYNIPSIHFSGKSWIKGATVYGNFHNLAIWSPWRGVDPEDNNNISLVEYPNPRMFVFGLDVRF